MYVGGAKCPHVKKSNNIRRKKVMKKIRTTIAIVVIASAIGGIIHQQIKINELVSSFEAQNSELSMEVDRQEETIHSLEAQNSELSKEVYRQEETILSLDKNLGYLIRNHGFTHSYGFTRNFNSTLNASDEYAYKVNECEILKSLSFEKPFEMVGSNDGDMYMVIETGEHTYTIYEIVDGMVEFDFDTHSNYDEIIWCTIFSVTPDLHYQKVNDGHYRWINWRQYGDGEIWFSEFPLTDKLATYNIMEFAEGM